MRRLTLLATLFGFTLSPMTTALAGGFPFDPTRCPQQQNWLPMFDIPQKVTDTLCAFLQAVDAQDYQAASRLLSPDFRSDTFSQFINSSKSTKDRVGTSGRSERFVIDARHSSQDLYQFVFEEMYQNRAFQQSVIVRYDNNDARIAGVQLGPY